MEVVLCDVRELPAPEPFEVGMLYVNQLARGQYLKMIHRKIPLLLLPQLKQRQMIYVIDHIEEELFYIYIYHQSDSGVFERISR